MTPEEMDQLADLVADRVREQPPPAYLSTAGVASLIGVSDAWVRAHSGELGAIRVGDQRHGVLRFDPADVHRAMERRRVRPVKTEPARRGRRKHFDLLPLPEGCS
jgi:hypothetical protein